MPYVNRKYDYLLKSIYELDFPITQPDDIAIVSSALKLVIRPNENKIKCLGILYTV
jgi:hypothetical protein